MAQRGMGGGYEGYMQGANHEPGINFKYRLKLKLLHHLELDAESEEKFHEEFYFEIMLLNLQMMMIHQVRDQ